VKFLLDTSIFLWALSNPARLSHQAHAILKEQREALWLSAVSVWEIAVKYELGRLLLPAPPALCIQEWITSGGLRILDITQHHALGVGSLPQHHHDPFDRMLIAQATLEGMTVLTSDRVFAKYAVPTIWCEA